MDSRLRQPGWSRNRPGSNERRDTSLPPILDKAGRGLLGGLGPADPLARAPARATSLGGGDDRAPERDDRSLPPLPRTTLSAPEARYARARPPRPGDVPWVDSAEARAERPERVERGDRAERVAARSSSVSALPRDRDRGSRSRPPAAPVAPADCDVPSPAGRGGRPPPPPRATGRAARQGTPPTTDRAPELREPAARAARDSRPPRDVQEWDPPDRVPDRTARASGHPGRDFDRRHEPARDGFDRRPEPAAAASRGSPPEVARAAPAPDRAQERAQERARRQRAREPVGRDRASRDVEPVERELEDPSRPRSPPIQAAGPLVPSKFAEKAAALEAEEGDPELLPCPHCGRKFNQQAHEKHVGICKKVFQSTRKVYNPTEHRLPDAPELAKVRQSAAQQTRRGQIGIGKAGDDQAKKTAWRQKSAAFRAAMRDAQVVERYQREGRPLSELPPPRALPPELDDRTQCPHCGRKFGEEQAKRHIPICKTTKARPNGLSRPAPAPAPVPSRGAPPRPRR